MHIIIEMSRAPKKRLFDRLLDICDAEKQADIDVVQSVSPMKMSNSGYNYYIGTIADDG